MKTLILINFLFVSLCGYCQNYNITYKCTDKIPSEIKHRFTNPESMIYSSLLINGKSSIYRIDSFITKEVLNYTSFLGAEEIYKNYTDDTWLKTSFRYQINSGYKRKLSQLISSNKFNWKETGNTKKILGMQCVEAVHNDKRVYYTKEIPIPDGPHYGIFGLSGLVLEYENQVGIWTVVSVQVFKDIIIDRPNVTEYDKESAIKLPIRKDVSDPRIITLNKNTKLNTWVKIKM